MDVLKFDDKYVLHLTHENIKFTDNYSTLLCEDCGVAMYCSKECKTKDKAVHDIACSHLKKLHFDDNTTDIIGTTTTTTNIEIFPIEKTKPVGTTASVAKVDIKMGDIIFQEKKPLLQIMSTYNKKRMEAALKTHTEKNDAIAKTLNEKINNCNDDDTNNNNNNKKEEENVVDSSSLSSNDTDEYAKKKELLEEYKRNILKKDRIDDSELLSFKNYDICQHLNCFKLNVENSANPSLLFQKKDASLVDEFVSEFVHVYDNFHFLIKYWIFYYDLNRSIPKGKTVGEYLNVDITNTSVSSSNSGGGGGGSALLPQIYQKIKKIYGSTDVTNVSVKYRDHKLEHQFISFIWLEKLRSCNYKSMFLKNTIVDVMLLMQCMFMNKSCQPNAILSQHDGTTFMFAMKDIKAGEEITYGYDYHIEVYDYEFRTMLLHDYMHISCRCNRCFRNKFAKENKFLDKAIDEELLTICCLNVTKMTTDPLQSKKKAVVLANKSFRKMFQCLTTTVSVKQLSKKKNGDIIANEIVIDAIKTVYSADNFNTIAAYPGMITVVLANMRKSIVTKHGILADRITNDIIDMKNNNLLYLINKDLELSSSNDNNPYSLLLFVDAFYNLFYFWCKNVFKIEHKSTATTSTKTTAIDSSSSSSSSDFTIKVLQMFNSQTYATLLKSFLKYNILQKKLKFIQHFEYSENILNQNTYYANMVQYVMFLLVKMQDAKFTKVSSFKEQMAVKSVYHNSNNSNNNGKKNKK